MTSILRSKIENNKFRKNTRIKFFVATIIWRRVWRGVKRGGGAHKTHEITEDDAPGTLDNTMGDYLDEMD